MVRQPVQKQRMGRWFTPDAKILGRAHEPVTEKMGPDLIDGYPRSDGVGGIDQPTGQVEPVSRALLVSWLEGMEQAEAAFADLMQRLFEFSSSEDVSFSGVVLSLGDYPDIGRRWFGGFFAEVVQLFAELCRFGVCFGEVVREQLALGSVSLGSVEEESLTHVFGYDVAGLLARDRHDAKPADDVSGAV